ncbi:M61 family metallopeptidase [Aquimarina macrocephali]|uniref:M61 family metallopeptidase n=1 Tax=Aquimarina macrocephali TaxID=666563 RepID=UPI003F661DFC
MIKKVLILSLILITLSCKSIKISESENRTTIDYSINLNDRSNDTFKITIDVTNLTKENAIFQFAATAPGTYKVMDIGRFVSNFNAFDANNGSLPVKKISVNQYELSAPQKTVKITYEIAETFDSKIKENTVYLMCGTSIENDHALINGQAVFGYFKGKQAAPFRVKIEYPNHWKIGTALKKDNQGRYLAKNYDEIVDSPILLGELNVASSKVGNTDIDVFTFSQNKIVNSNEILSSMEEILVAADKFLYGLPVDRYTFLFFFDNKDAGAWEHSYSSGYVLRENKWSVMEQFVKNTAAHEFFHIVTPLNIHSEIIEQFNFVKPVPSKHLWLYEATTEWAANTMLFRSDQISLEEYFELLHRKVDASQFFDSNYSLEKLSLNSYSNEGQEQYVNIYHRGALTMGLLDIKLLELSNGKKGLRELVNDLIQKYGPSKPFKEDTFYDEIVSMSNPEIKIFIDNYIIGAKPLPLKEIYKKIGVNFIEQVIDTTKSQTGLRYYLTEKGFIILKCSEEASKIGFKEGDIIKTVNNKAFDENTISDIKKMWSLLNPNDTYSISIIRNGNTINLDGMMFPKVTNYVFEIDSKATQEAKALFKIWSKSL